MTVSPNLLSGRAFNGRRLGVEGYVKLLAAAKTPTLARDMAVAAGTSIKRVFPALHAWRRMGIMGRVEWIQATPGRARVPLWRLGKDDTEPAGARRALARNCKPSIYVTTLGTVLQILEDGPTTRVEMAEELGMSDQTAARLLTLLHKHGLVYVSSYRRQAKGPPVRVYSAGSARDAVRPKRLDKSVLAVAWRATARAKQQQAMLCFVGAAA